MVPPYRPRKNNSFVSDPSLLLLGLVLIVLIALVVYVFFFLNKQDPSTVSQNTTKYIVVNAASNDKYDDPMLRDPVIARDHRVMDDPLYPPLARQGADNTRALLNEPRLKPSRLTDSFDSYRLAGYLVSQEDRNDTWKLFAREKYPRRSDSDFYVSSANRNMEYKLPLTPEITSPRLRDLYSLPDHVNINHPLFAHTPYAVVQLPPANMATQYF